MEEWTRSRAKQVTVVVFSMCKVLRKLLILGFSHIYYTLFLQSRVCYHTYTHLLMMWSKIQDHVNFRWSFTYRVEYAPTFGTVDGDLDLIRRSLVKSSTSNTRLFLSGHHLFTYVHDYFFSAYVFLDQTEGPVFPLFPSAG